MSEGATQDVKTLEIGEVLIGLKEALGRVEGKLDGLVTHEKHAEKVADLRKEWRDDIRDSEADIKTKAEEREAAAKAREDLVLEKAVAAAKSAASAAVQDALETQDKNMKRARTAMWMGGGVGVGSAALAVLNVFGG